MSKKTIEDDLLLKLIDDYFEEECNHNSGLVSVPKIVEYISQKADIKVSNSYLHTNPVSRARIAVISGKKNTTKYSLGSFGLSRSEVDRDLSKYYDMMNSSQGKKGNIEKNWVSVEDYIDTLYILKFVRKLSNSEIDKLAGKHMFFTIYGNSGLYWEYPTNDFDECEKRREEDLKILAEYRNESRKQLELYKTEEYKIFEDKLLPKISRSILGHRNFEDGAEWFVREIYYLYQIKQLSVNDVAKAYGDSWGAMQTLFRGANITISRTEAQRRATEHGKRNYGEIHRRGRTTRAKYTLENALEGSVAENAIRTMIDGILPDYFSTDKYEIVVGINSRSIIPPLEVDIPVLLIDKESNIVNKIAVEVNGSIFHENQKRDDDKAEMLKTKDWTLMGIWYDQKLVNNPSIVKERVVKLVQEMKLKVDGLL